MGLRFTICSDCTHMQSRFAKTCNTAHMCDASETPHGNISTLRWATRACAQQRESTCIGILAQRELQRAREWRWYQFPASTQKKKK